MLGFVSRTLCKQVFISLVKPHLEYCSSVWNQLANKYVSEIEAIQSRAARLILQRYHYTMYMRGLCHNLTTYTVHGREWRREEILWASASWTKSQQPSMHSTHDCHQHATYHPEKMLVIPSCNQLYQKSYYLCTLSAWNALPKKTIHVTSLDSLPLRIYTEELDFLLAFLLNVPTSMHCKWVTKFFQWGARHCMPDMGDGFPFGIHISFIYRVHLLQRDYLVATKTG